MRKVSHNLLAICIVLYRREGMVDVRMNAVSINAKVWFR